MVCFIGHAVTRIPFAVIFVFLLAIKSVVVEESVPPSSYLEPKFPTPDETTTEVTTEVTTTDVTLENKEDTTVTGDLTCGTLLRVPGGDRHEPAPSIPGVKSNKEAVVPDLQPDGSGAGSSTEKDTTIKPLLKPPLLLTLPQTSYTSKSSSGIPPSRFKPSNLPKFSRPPPIPQTSNSSQKSQSNSSYSTLQFRPKSSHPVLPAHSNGSYSSPKPLTKNLPLQSQFDSSSSALRPPPPTSKSISSKINYTFQSQLKTSSKPLQIKSKNTQQKFFYTTLPPQYYVVTTIQPILSVSPIMSNPYAHNLLPANMLPPSPLPLYPFH